MHLGANRLISGQKGKVMLEQLYNDLPVFSKAYYLIIIVLLLSIDIVLYRFYSAYKKNNAPKEKQTIRLKEKK